MPAAIVPVPWVGSSLIESQKALAVHGNLTRARVAGRNENIVRATCSIIMLPRNGSHAQRREDSGDSRCYDRFG